MYICIIKEQLNKIKTMASYKNTRIFYNQKQAVSFVGKPFQRISAECGCGETKGVTGPKGHAAICKFCAQ